VGDNFLDAANGEAERLTVIVGRVAGSTVEVQEVTVRSANLRTAPVVPVRALVEERSVGGATATRSREEDTLTQPVAASKVNCSLEKRVYSGLLKLSRPLLRAAKNSATFKTLISPAWTPIFTHPS
jgi:hypothetical protein